MNRALSIRSRKKDDHSKEASKHTFSISTLRGIQQAELSKKLFKLIKTENHAIGAYETAGRERLSIASQLSDWGESTGDESISDVSDKIGVILSEIGEQEDLFAQNLEDYRSVLKQIRNIESSVQPSRDQKAKISDEIQKLKYKEPTSPKLVTLEQELVRAEAQNLVAEAQLTNITRQKVKEAFDINFAATIERAEKQIILAKYGRRLLNLLDDTPVVPGDVRQPFEHGAEARTILADAEQDLQAWEPQLEPIHSNAGGLGTGAMPTGESSTRATSEAHGESSLYAAATTEKPAAESQGTHLEAATA
ncbi:Eisosome component PIL1-domain-containing protein [Exophiala viscosa]|uniref:Eisosome component PIL1-domain-containing protein n=1 Tax=Exophiala viscosa TaxID=2486360 RepID=A0AAN6DTM4_9EURO|nr:Eisosome component PIL1-domain-containing protein [Exophiala viscosa]KAI1625535.1 Eisosome component PIL1-domain-containing protein [Exophiala viscosa]